MRSANLSFQYDHEPQNQQDHVLNAGDIIRRVYVLHRLCTIEYVIEFRTFYTGLSTSQHE
jgi:hypothetical protein